MPNWDTYDPITTPDDADTLLTHHVSETIVGKKMRNITWANIKATLLTYFYTIFPNKNGWMPVADTWTYASASTLNVPAGALTKYSAYGKAKFTQHGVAKFGYIYPTSDTLLTFYGGTDFVVENTATYPITNIYYSNASSPVGFPQRFAYTPSLGGSTWTVVGTLTALGYFSINSGIMKVYVSLAGSTSIANIEGYVTLPINPIRNDVSFMTDDYASHYQNGSAVTGGAIYPGAITTTSRVILLSTNYYLL